MVRYGTATQFLSKAFASDFACDSGTFGGDPAPGAAKDCRYGPQITTTIAPQTSNMAGPWVNHRKIPVGDSGIGELRVATGQPQPELSDSGAFRISCNYSHMNFDDPIVYPNQQGASHLHVYFGNTAVNYASTAESIANTGNSTCAGGIVNRSAYWVPALIDTRTGIAVAPTENGVYYKAFGPDVDKVKPMPIGLRVLAGNMRASTPEQVDVRSFYWRCKEDTAPTADTSAKPSIPDCEPGTELWMVLEFPNCWDGVNLDSPDHRSHMAYSRGYDCPASHSYRIPNVTYHIKYKVRFPGDARYWRLSSDMYNPSKPAGYSLHGDWINGWIPGIRDAWLRNCINTPRDSNNNLCDGRALGQLTFNRAL
jgi:Domain of unknown function (DUF1996)